MARKSKVVEAEVVDNDGDFVPEVQPVVAETEDSFDMPSDEAREKVKVLKDSLKDDYIELCRILYFIHKKQMYSSWGFGTFDEYVTREMEFEKSKARHLLQIWECLYERHGNKEVFSKVMSIGWTKASKLIHVVNADNVNEWVEKGRHMSVENLVKEVKEFLNKKISDEPSEALATAGEVEGTPMELAMKSVTLQLHHDDYLAICQAVERVQNMQQGVSFSQAISLMARDFIATNPKSDLSDPKATYVEYLKKYESMSDLQLVIIDSKEKEILHGFDYLKNLTSQMSDDSSDLTADLDAETAFT